MGTGANAITDGKYALGLLLNIENLYRDILRLNSDVEALSNEAKTESTNDLSQSKQLLQLIIDNYLNHEKYLFADMFGQFHKGQMILERLYPHIESTNHLELIFTHFYSSLSYMIHQWSTTFHIPPTVLNTISLIHQQINAKKLMFEQLLNQVYTYYNERMKVKLLEIYPGM